MGEAKRRKELGLPPRISFDPDYNTRKDKIISWLPVTRTQLSRYPYLPVVTMALGLILLLVDWTSFNASS